MNILNELCTILRKRYKQMEREANKALTDELQIIYRAKAAEAQAIYIIVYNMKIKLMRERARDAEAELTE